MLIFDQPPPAIVEPARQEIVRPGDCETLDRALQHAGAPRHVRRAIRKLVERYTGQPWHELKARARVDHPDEALLMGMLRKKKKGGGGNDANTVLLLQADDQADGSTTITDSATGGNAPHTVTAVGGAQIDTAIKKFGAGAILLPDASGDRFTVPDSADWDVGSGDFTIDFWIYFHATSSNNGYLVAHAAGPSASNGFLLYLPAGTNLRFRYNSTDVSFTVSWSTGTWYHLAVVRSGSDLKVFRGGTQLGSTHNIGATAITDNSELLVFGDRGAGGSGQNPNCSFDGIRFSKGIARWTENFTPPSAAYS